MTVPVAHGAEPASSRPHVSSNGRYSVRAISPDPKTCQLEITQETEVVWESPRCFGTLDDLYFISNDGVRVWVLRALPNMAKVKNPRLLGSVAGRAIGAILVGKPGNVVASRTVNSFMKTVRARGKIEGLSTHFRWLQGAVGKGGKPPRSNDNNQVEFETLDGRTHRLRF
ncbi:MAG: hypothetical protein ACKVPX_17030 [Myxococcaceae bacterium]